ncbi:MAG: hypothetical protein IKK08_10725 [Clostridia bacterium]|nr:hypothetical protein [Clostridia bacterium]
MNQQPIYPNLPASRHTMTVGVRLHNGVRTQCSIFSTNHGLFGYLDAEGEVFLDLKKAAAVKELSQLMGLLRHSFRVTADVDVLDAGVDEFISVEDDLWLYDEYDEAYHEGYYEEYDYDLYDREEFSDLVDARNEADGEVEGMLNILRKWAFSLADIKEVYIQHCQATEGANSQYTLGCIASAVEPHRVLLNTGGVGALRQALRRYGFFTNMNDASINNAIGMMMDVSRTGQWPWGMSVVSRQTLNMEDRTIRLEDRFLLKTGLTIEEMDDLFEAPPAPSKEEPEEQPADAEAGAAAGEESGFTAGDGQQV